MNHQIYNWQYEQQPGGAVCLVAYDLATGDEIWRTLPCTNRQSARNLAGAWMAAQARNEAVA